MLRRHALQFWTDPEAGGGPPPSAPEPKSKHLSDPPAFTPITSQDSFDAAIADRLRRQEDALKKSVRDDVEAEIKVKADEAAKKEQGDFKALYEAAEAERVKLDNEVKSRQLADTKRAVAAKHNLPPWLADRLQGETEGDLEKDAKQLATAAKEPEVDTDAGKRTAPRSNGEPPAPRPAAFGGTGPFVERPGYESKKE